jgi:hypothetical protein
MTDMSALKPLVGRWATTITMLSPPEVKGQVYRAVDTYRWLPGELVLIHEVEARMGEDVVNSVEIYTCSDGQVVSRNFDSKGHVSDYRATMTDGVWSVVGDTERFESTSISHDAIEGLWRLKGEGGWADWMTVRLDRVA